MRTTLIMSLSVAAILPTSSVFAKDEVSEFRPLSEKGIEIVASRAYKGQKIIQQMLERVNKVDTAYREHITMYTGLKSCKEGEVEITTLTPESKIDSTYTLSPERKVEGKGAPDTCKLDMTTVTKTTNWTVNCTLTMKQANTISDEAISSFASALKRFRNDGLYSNISPSATLTKLQQSETCRMVIDPSAFE